MDGRKRARRQIEDLVGFAAYHVAHARGFLLGDTGQRQKMTLDLFDRLGECLLDLVGFGRQVAGGLQQALAFGHGLADQRLGIGLGLRRGFADQRLSTGSGIVQRLDDPSQRRRGGIADLFQTLGFAGETGRQLGPAGLGIGHQMFDAALRLAGDIFETFGFRTQLRDRLRHRFALFAEPCLEALALVLETLQQFVHRGAMPLVTAEHEFGTCHGGIGHRFDALGLAVELDGGGMRRLGRRIGGVAEIGGVRVERVASRFQGTFGGFDGGLELGGAAGHDLTGAGRRIGQRAGDRIDAVALLRQAGGDGIGPHIDAGAGLVDGGNLVLEHAFERPQAGEGSIQPRIEAIQLPAHGPAQTGGGARGALIGAEQAFADLGQGLGGLAHGLAPGEGPGGHDQQGRGHDRGEAQKGKLLEIEGEQAAGAEIAPSIGRGRTEPESAQNRGKGHRRIAATRPPEPAFGMGDVAEIFGRLQQNGSAPFRSGIRHDQGPSSTATAHLNRKWPQSRAKARAATEKARPGGAPLAGPVGPWNCSQRIRTCGGDAYADAGNGRGRISGNASSDRRNPRA